MGLAPRASSMIAPTRSAASAAMGSANQLNRRRDQSRLERPSVGRVCLPGPLEPFRLIRLIPDDSYAPRVTAASMADGPRVPVEPKVRVQPGHPAPLRGQTGM